MNKRRVFVASLAVVTAMPPARTRTTRPRSSSSGTRFSRTPFPGPAGCAPRSYCNGAYRHVRCRQCHRARLFALSRRAARARPGITGSSGGAGSARCPRRPQPCATATYDAALEANSERARRNSLGEAPPSVPASPRRSSTWRQKDGWIVSGLPPHVEPPFPGAGSRRRPTTRPPTFTHLSARRQWRS